MFGILRPVKHLFMALFSSETEEKVSIQISFMTFLIMQDAYEDFVREFEEFNGGEITFSRYLDTATPLEYIIGAFSWDDKAWSRWSILNLKWKLFLCKEL